MTSLTGELLRINRAQWALEDQTRNPRSARTRAAVERGIDESNARRNRVIQDIDQVVVTEFHPPLYSSKTRLLKNSESVGRLLDRLTISIIRQSHFEVSLAQGSVELDDKLKIVSKEFSYHVAILKTFLTRLRGGRASYAPEMDVKDYRPRS